MNKNAKKWNILAIFLKAWILLSNIVTRQVNFNTKKIGGKCQFGELLILRIFLFYVLAPKNKILIALECEPDALFLFFVDTFTASINAIYSCFLQSQEENRSKTKNEVKVDASILPFLADAMPPTPTRMWVVLPNLDNQDWLSRVVASMLPPL